MRILLLNFEYPPLGGGASPVSQSIARKLSEKGHRITVVTMAHGNLPLEESENDLITIYRIDSGRIKANMSYPMEHIRFLRNARKFLSVHLREETYDVTHCHFILSTGILAQWVKRKFAIPYIITSHGSDLPGFNPDRFQLIHWITPYFIRSILKNCSFVVSPSKYLSTLILPHLKNREKLKLIPNGIEDTYEVSKKENIILSTGRLLERKGFHTLIKAVAGINSTYEVHICGDGPMMNQLKILAKSSKTKIVFHGWIDNTSTEYKSLLSKAQIYCLVSEFENASISLLEAMINSCAVITSNTSGCPETVGESGICLTPYDYIALRKCILRLIEDSNETTNLGIAARKRALSTYSWNAIASGYETLLQTASNNE